LLANAFAAPHLKAYVLGGVSEITLGEKQSHGIRRTPQRGDEGSSVTALGCCPRVEPGTRLKRRFGRARVPRAGLEDGPVDLVRLAAAGGRVSCGGLAAARGH